MVMARSCALVALQATSWEAPSPAPLLLLPALYKGKHGSSSFQHVELAQVKLYNHLRVIVGGGKASHTSCHTPRCPAWPTLCSRDRTSELPPTWFPSASLLGEKGIITRGNGLPCTVDACSCPVESSPIGVFVCAQSYSSVCVH